MGKKQRRKQPRRVPAPTGRSAATVPIAEVARMDGPRRTLAVPKPRVGTTWEEFTGRYRYVNAELKQIGILAGSFLVVLLILDAVLG